MTVQTLLASPTELTTFRRVILYLYLLCVSSLTFSMALNSICFALWLVLWVTDVSLRRAWIPLWQKVKSSPICIATLLLLVCFGTATAFASDPSVGWGTLKKTLYPLGVFYMADVAGLFKDKQDFKKPLQDFFFVATFGCILEIFVFLTYKVFDFPYYGRGTTHRLGAFNHPLFTGQLYMLYALLGTALAIDADREGSKKRNWILGGTTLFVVACAYTYSRSPIVGLWVGLMLMLVMTPKWKTISPFMILLPMVVALSINYNPQTYSDEVSQAFLIKTRTDTMTGSYRRELWLSGLNVFMNMTVGEKLIGIGDGDEVKARVIHYISIWEGHLHSDYLMMLITNGILGLSVFCGMIVTFLVVAFRKVREPNNLLQPYYAACFAAVAVFAAVGVVEWNLAMSSTGQTFWFMVALLEFFRTSEA